MGLHNFQRSTLIPNVVLLLIILLHEILQPSQAESSPPVFQTYLLGNVTEEIKWVFGDNSDAHILNCTLAEGVEPDVFEWTLLDGPDGPHEGLPIPRNSTNIIYNEYNETTRSISLQFVEITFDVIDSYKCESIVWGNTSPFSNNNITKVKVLVDKTKNIQLIIWMSIASVVFAIIGIAFICKGRFRRRSSYNYSRL